MSTAVTPGRYEIEPAYSALPFPARFVAVRARGTFPTLTGTTDVTLPPAAGGGA